jgi:hypothetical protein
MGHHKAQIHYIIVSEMHYKTGILSSLRSGCTHPPAGPPTHTPPLSRSPLLPPAAASRPRSLVHAQASTSSSDSSLDEIRTCRRCRKVRRCAHTLGRVHGRVSHLTPHSSPPLLQTSLAIAPRQPYRASENHRTACLYHPEMYTGGEIAKYIGFVRASERPEDQLVNVVGRTGLAQFWDCCGATEEDAPGCTRGYHVGYGDPDPE